jgi:hypothetical protein
MNCHEIENRISAYLDNELSVQDRKQFDAHLAECRSCKEFADEMKQVDAILLESEAPLPDEAYWSGFDARLKDKIDKVPVKRPWWNFGHLFRKQLHWAALAALVVMAMVFPVLREFTAPPASMRTQAPVSVATTADEKLKAPSESISSRDEENIKNEISGQAAPGGAVSEQPPVVHAPAPGIAEPDTLVETESGNVSMQPESKYADGVSSKVSSGDNSSGFNKEKAAKKDNLPNNIDAAPVPPAPAAPEPAIAPKAEIPAPAKDAHKEMAESAPMGTTEKTNSSRAGKGFADAPAMLKSKPAPAAATGMPADKFDADKNTLRESAAEPGLYDFKSEEARKMAQVPEVSDYLAASEAVLIRIITLPEDEKKLKMFQEELNMAKFSDTVNKTSDRAKNVVIINNHAKTMQNITNEVMNISPGQINSLKRKVIDSGIIDKTRELKQ